MLAKTQEQEYQILRILSDSPEPLGAGALAIALEEHGLFLSEATVGRLLRELEVRNYAKRNGFQGRSLTSEGRERLRVLSEDRSRVRSTDQFLDVLQDVDPSTLLDVLVARRALERETARLAARLATEGEIEELRAMLRAEGNARSRKERVSQHDVAFHALIARAAKNKVLSAALELIRGTAQWGPLFERIRTEQGRLTGQDHMKLFSAIERRDEQGAEEAMIAHIDNVLQDVRQYLRKAP